jgi:uncharacterized short protein YbdD (DUF466 family)
MKIFCRLMAYLRELAKTLADEAAYQRYLEKTATPHSAQAWRTFSDARLKRKYQNGKCC